MGYLKEKMKAQEAIYGSAEDSPGLRNSRNLEEYLKKQFILDRLLEAYRRPDLSWIENFVDEIYKNPDDMRDIGKKYKTKLLSSDIIDDNHQILSASYSKIKDIYEITLTENAISDLEEGRSRNKDELKTELYEFLVHEETHRQQNQLNQYKQKYTDLPINATSEDADKHVSQKVEIDANGRGIAYEALKKIPHNSKDELIKKIITENKIDLDILSDKSKALLLAYRRIGGKVWRKFIRRLYDFISYGFSVKGLADYNLWLSNHKS
jgi:hypothetical protein